MTSQRPKPLPVVFAVAARVELDEIWEWNERTFGRRHAAKYVDFLIKRIETLSKDYYKGRPVGTRPEYRYLPVKRRSRGHGHVAVYAFDQHAVSILHIFHSAQDWQAKLAIGKPIE